MKINANKYLKSYFRQLGQGEIKLGEISQMYIKLDKTSKIYESADSRFVLKIFSRTKKEKAVKPSLISL